MAVRDRIRADLLDADMLTHLEGCGSINWIATTTWQCQAVSAGGVAGGAESEWVNADQLNQYLEVSTTNLEVGVAGHYGFLPGGLLLCSALGQFCG